MEKVKITDLRAHLPDYLKKVSNGEEFQITNHGKVIARLVPEADQKAEAQKRLNALKGTMIIGDIVEPIEQGWDADAVNL